MKNNQEKPKILVVGQPGVNPLDMVKMISRTPDKLVLVDPRNNRGSFKGVACGGKK
jgi:hypothetical protein